MPVGPNDSKDSTDYFDDEYETDTDAGGEEGEEGEEGKGYCDDDEEEVQWSLRVRLLSAVDLPPSLSPSVPLCPWFKFGLVEDVNAALDKVEEDRRREHQKRLEEEQRDVRRGRTLRPRREGEDGGSADGDIDDDHERQHLGQFTAPKHENPNTTKTNTTTRLLSTLPPSLTRTSTCKIMSRNANGGGGNGADWNEEYRWTDLGSPMESCLAVRLCTRLAPDNAGIGGGAIAGTAGAMASSSSLTRLGENYDASSDAGSGSYLHDNEESALGLGIRGLWRKGREQLEEHRRRTTGFTVNSREEKAATVAHFLMRGGGAQGGDDATAASSTTSPSSSHHGLNQQDLIEYQQRWKQQQQQQEWMGGTAMGDYDESTGAVRTTKFHGEEVNLDGYCHTEGLCLGTLTVPLSRLPLEDAFIGNNAAIVEKWYQLEDPNTNAKNRVSDISAGKREGSNSNISALGDDEEPRLLHGPRRCPSVLLEITFASSDFLDESEEDICGWDGNQPALDLASSDMEEAKENASLTPVPEAAIEKHLTKENEQDKKPPEPELEPGIIDFLCVVGARDIGNQRSDDGSRGWVHSTPGCCVLERYPLDDGFHNENGRNTGLIPQIEWFCFPEGCRLWRGTGAPTVEDLRRGGVSCSANSGGGGNSNSAMGRSVGNKGSSSHLNATSSNSANNSPPPSRFDTALNTTTSFSWFVLSSNSDVYGSRLVKTYGAVVRFYVPAPKGIDPTQDDFAQTRAGGSTGGRKDGYGRQKERARLWVPIGIVITTTLPIVGVVEELLLRTCDAMTSKLSSDDGSTMAMAATTTSTGSSNLSPTVSKLYAMLQKDLYHLIVNHPRPLEGTVHCSLPFLEGERLHVTTSPLNGLPPLPHGGAVSMVCRLLSAEGLTLLLAAALTECRILIHSSNVADVALVAEVITALIFPFAWQLPYIPVLPKGMLEILDAPLPFFVGVPSKSLELVESNILGEVVTVDLDDIARFTEYDARRGPRTKIPPALPASVSTSISKAVHRLLKEEDELERETRTVHAIPGLRRSPRLETESLPERMFRIHVALQICSLVRGYQECLFFVSASQPVFNRDRFLRQAPALFEDKRPSVLIDSNFSDRSQRILSPRSKRFLSVLVNTQHFHQLLERLSSEETAFFHEVMEAIEGSEEEGPFSANNNNATSYGSKSYHVASYGSSACEEAAQNLFESLEAIEQQIPTYVINRQWGKQHRRRSALGNWTWDDDSDDEWKFEPFASGDEPFWLLPECNPPKDGEKDPTQSFTYGVLKPIMADEMGGRGDMASSSGDAGVHALSLEYLVELEKNPWRYSNMLDLPLFGGAAEGKVGGKQEQDKQQQWLTGQVFPRVKLREALGELRFRAWKVANDSRDEEDLVTSTPVAEPSDGDGLDLSGILQNVPELPLGGEPEAAKPRADAGDRERVRRCLELAFDEGREVTEQAMSEAELALRNPSAQRYLSSVLVSSVQRTRKLAARHEGDSGRASVTRTTQQQAVSRLEPGAFECVVRLCYAVLEACIEEQNYESAYRLLTFTGGFCTTMPTSGVGGSVGATVQQAEQKTVYMTERISIHPIFVDLRLWERVLLLHQQDQQNNDRKEDANAARNEDQETRLCSEAQVIAEGETEEEILESDAYDNVVTTLYEMVGYNVPAEEVSRFATRISEEKGWFATEKGQALLVLARRLTAKRDEGHDWGAGDHGEGKTGRDSEFSFVRKDSSVPNKDHHVGIGIIGDDTVLESDEIAWSHPSMCLVSNERQGVGARTFLGNMLGGAAAEMTATNSAHGGGINHGSAHGGSTHGSSAHGARGVGGGRGVLDANGGNYVGRVAITAMASFGGSVVVTGGIDGSVFLAHTINFGGSDGGEYESNSHHRTNACASALHYQSRLVNGVRLQWGGRGESMDRGDPSSSAIGSVTCVAASKGSGYRFGGGGANKSSSNPNGDGLPDEEEIMSSLDGCWVIAGTTGGSLRVWSLWNVYYASCMTLRRDYVPLSSSSPSVNRSHHGSGAASVRLSAADDFGMQDAVAGVPVGGHRGGVTCIDLPPRMYRPDSLVSGGEDSLIKLWSLKAPSSGSESQVGGVSKNSIQSRLFHSGRQITASVAASTDFDASDGAQGVLAGHEGKILCVKTAWHGDRLLSGGADKTARLWDLSGTTAASGGGKPLTTLRGHQGWVTQTYFWGPNAIVSASTDRSIHLWDSRVNGSSPLFALRYHPSPVSDLLLGSRSEPMMVSAGSDGSIAAWDFRVLSNAKVAEPSLESMAKAQRTIRSPMAKMNHVDLNRPSSARNCGSIRLARSVRRDDFSFLSIGDDAVINEWEAPGIGEKKLCDPHDSGHWDVISGFLTYTSGEGLPSIQSMASGGSRSGVAFGMGGTISCSWDGTVRLRRLSRKPAC